MIDSDRNNAGTFRWTCTLENYGKKKKVCALNSLVCGSLSHRCLPLHFPSELQPSLSSSCLLDMLTDFHYQACNSYTLHLHCLPLDLSMATSSCLSNSKYHNFQGDAPHPCFVSIHYTKTVTSLITVIDFLCYDPFLPPKGTH